MSLARFLVEDNQNDIITFNDDENVTMQLLLSRFKTILGKYDV